MKNKKIKEKTKEKMTIKKAFFNSIEFMKTCYFKSMVFLTLLMSGTLFSTAFADNNPFPDIDIGGGDVVDVAGKKMQFALKYTMMGVGGVLVLIGIATLIHRLREDNRDKEHGNLLMSMVMIALCLVVGFIMIAIGWKAFNQQIQS